MSTGVWQADDRWPDGAPLWRGRSCTDTRAFRSEADASAWLATQDVSSCESYPTPNGPKALAQIITELRAAGWNGDYGAPAQVVDAYVRTAGAGKPSSSGTAPRPRASESTASMAPALSALAARPMTVGGLQLSTWQVAAGGAVLYLLLIRRR